MIKKLLLALCLTVVLAPALRAEEVSPAELKRAVQYLEKTRADLFAATKGLSAAQWNFKPATNRWSVAEVTEHIAAAEDFLRDMFTNKVMTASARAAGEDVKAIDEFVLQAVPDRSHKVSAPEPLQPNNRFGSPKDSLKHFKASRAETIKALKKTKGLRDHALESPLGKKLDGYQWFLFISAHSERHVKQLNEVKADPAFPKK
ncbi:MAG: DinB family protein [Verrucomicrobiota bacterium]